MPTSLISSFIGVGSISFRNELSNGAAFVGLVVKSVDIDVNSVSSSQPLSTQQLAESSVQTTLSQLDVFAAKVLRPTFMRITGFYADAATLSGILSVFAETRATLSVSSKGIMASNMAVTDVEIEQGADILSASKVVITLEQTVHDAPETSYNPEQPVDSNSNGIGIQVPQTSLQTVQGLYAKVSSFF